MQYALTVPCIWDRLIQQCIKQVLEPICEAKFHNHSYGFRPNRSCENVLARYQCLVNKIGLHYVIDIDIRGFFDNVNHGKLLKQLWTQGIRDKKVIKIISRMLKAEIKGIGVPMKGTPQGGILSPLLSNVVLNELDWWVASQWDKFPSKYKYPQSYNKSRALRKTRLKEIKIVRYADDFKIMCKDHKTAHKIFAATKKWLKERLHLEISNEKSKITNIRKNYSEFLGFKLRVKRGKANKYTNRSHIKDSAKTKAIETLKKRILEIKKSPDANAVNKYNATVLGLHNYYKIATMVSIDFNEIAYIVNKSLKCRTRRIRKDTGKENEAYKKFYGQYSHRKVFVAGCILFPISAIKFNAATKASQEICRYSAKGREKIHDNLKLDISIMAYLMSNPIKGQTLEYNDNRISLYAGQLGKCSVTEDCLQIGNMEVHHITPKENGGPDNYSNLTFVTEPVHKLIHAKQTDTIEFYKNLLRIDKCSLKKLNKLRVLAGNDVITSN